MNIRFCNRRGFLTGVVPGCVATCFCLKGWVAQAQSPQEKPPAAPAHKFDKPCGRALTYRQRFRQEFSAHFIPYIKVLDRAVGRAKVIETLHELCRIESEEYAAYVVKAKGKNDLSVFKEDYSPSTPGMNDMLTMEVLEDTDRVWAIKITECLWAKTFQDAGAAQYGYAAVCAGDALFAHAVNPKIDLDLNGTIMEGKPSCTLRYYVTG
jgi:hypothetical protein